MKKRYVIWSNNLDLEDWRDDLLAEAEENGESAETLTEQDLYERMYERNADYLEDERVNLSHVVFNEPILVIANLGLWNGRHKGYKEIQSGKVTDCLYSDTDYIEWYVDAYGNMRCDATHHDGTNHYLYRAWKPGLSEYQKDNLREAILEGKATTELIGRYTHRIGDKIAAVFGWSVKGVKSAV